MAMMLFERGSLKLESPVRPLLPEFVSLSPPSANRRARSRDRTHVAGPLQRPAGLREALRVRAEPRRTDSRSLATPLVADPGSQADYSDIGFILLGEILARIAGEPLDDFAQRKSSRLLACRALGSFRRWNGNREIPPTEDDRTFRHRVIQGEVNDENAWVMGGVAGHAGLFASATDIARFAECLLRGGTPMVQSSHGRFVHPPRRFPEGTSRALGWDTPSQPSSSGTHFSPRSFGHLGFTGTSLWIDPDRQLSVTLLTNRTWPDRSSRAIRQVWPLLHDAIVEAL